MRTGTSNNKIFTVISILSLLGAVYCVLFSGNVHYKPISILPFSLFIFNALFSRILNKIAHYIPFTIIYLQLIIRFLVLPVLIASGGVFIGGFYSNNADAAILLMVFELFAVFMAFAVVAHQKNRLQSQPLRIGFFKNNLLIFIILIAGIAYMLSRQTFLLKTNFVWNMSDYYLDEVNRETAKEAENMDSVIFFRLRLLFVLFFIGLIWKSGIMSKKWKWKISMLIVLLNATIIEGSSRFSIVYITFPFVMILFYLYPGYKKQMLVSGGIALFIVLLSASLVKFSTIGNQAGTDDVLNTNVLNAYFSGPGNMALGIDTYNRQFNGNRLLYLASDLFQNVPGLAKQVQDNYRTTRAFNYQYYGSAIGKDQIVPIPISALFHFGYLFFWLYNFIFCLLAFKFEALSKKQYFVGGKYVFLLLSLNCSLFMMLNVGSITSNIITQPILTLLPLLILYKGLFIFKKRHSYERIKA